MKAPTARGLKRAMLLESGGCIGIAAVNQLVHWKVPLPAAPVNVASGLHRQSTLQA